MDLRIDRRQLLKRGAIVLGSLAVAGTAALSRSQSTPSQKSGTRPYVTALGKGCDPTGRRVCTAQLQAMLRDAAGGTAWLEQGTYLFNQTLVCPPGTTLDGHGTLKLADQVKLSDSAGALLLSNNCTVHGITLDGNKTTQVGNFAMILGGGVSGIRVVGVSVRDAPGRSIYLNRCSSSQIDGCHIERGGLINAEDGTRASISTLESSHVRVANNRIMGSSGEGILLACGDASVVKNDIRDTHSIGIAVGGGQRRNILIADNHVQIDRTWFTPDGLEQPNCIDVGDSSICVVSGNHTEGGSTGLNNAPPSYRTIVIDNKFNRSIIGIAMGGAGADQPVNLVINGNSCVGNRQMGIGVAGAAVVEIRGNTCMDNGQSSAGQESSADPHKKAGVFATDVNRVTIERNRCGDGQQTKTQLFGVAIDGANNKGNRVADNDLRGNGTSAISDNSKAGSTVYSGNAE